MRSASDIDWAREKGGTGAEADPPPPPPTFEV